MNNISFPGREIPPFYQLMLLIAFAVVGTLVFMVIGMAITVGLYGTGIVGDMMSGELNAGNLAAFKILQVAYTIGVALVPPIILALIERKKITELYFFKKPVAGLLLITLMLVMVSMPFMEWTAQLNQDMKLPESLSKLEKWFREMEDKATEQVIIFLKVTAPVDILVNLLIIAVVPAIAEELMFRGGVQRAFSRMFSNHHAAIWVSAALFSAWHLQFFGFLPRMLLGAAFGYLYYWSGNLWYAIFAHFLNNAYAVIVAYYMQQNNIPLDSTESLVDTPWYGYLISVILTVFTIVIFKKLAARNERLG